MIAAAPSATVGADAPDGRRARRHWLEELTFFSRPVLVLRDLLALTSLVDFAEWFKSGRGFKNNVKRAGLRPTKRRGRGTRADEVVMVRRDGNCLFACLWLSAYLSRRGDCCELNRNEVSDAVALAEIASMCLRRMYKEFILNNGDVFVGVPENAVRVKELRTAAHWAKCTNPRVIMAVIRNSCS